MAPVEDVAQVWLGSGGVSLSVLPAVATTSRPHTALAVNPVSLETHTQFFFLLLCD